LTEAPSVTFRAEGLDFDFDKSVLQPLRLILGKQPITVKTSLSCYYPKCARSPEGCAVPDSAENPLSRGRLCLRVSAEISDGKNRSYVYTRVQLDNDTLKKEIREEFAKIALAAILRADPVTAALLQLKHVETGAFADDRSRLRAQEHTVKAASEAQKSSCWRGNILSRMYLATGDLDAADRELIAVERLSIWDRITSLDWASCRRQTEYTRALYRRKVLLSSIIGRAEGARVHEEAKLRRDRVLAEITAVAGGGWAGDADLSGYAALILGTYEILSAQDFSCALIPPNGVSKSQDEDHVRKSAQIISEWHAMADRGTPVRTPMAEPAAIDFIRALRDRKCTEESLRVAADLAAALPESAAAAAEHGDAIIASTQPDLDLAALRYTEAIERSSGAASMRQIVNLIDVKMAQLLARPIPTDNEVAHSRAAAARRDLLALFVEAEVRFDQELYPPEMVETVYQSLSRWAAFLLIAKQELGQDPEWATPAPIVSFLGILGIMSGNEHLGRDPPDPAVMGGRLACTVSILQSLMHRPSAQLIPARLRAMDGAFLRSARIKDFECAQMTGAGGEAERDLAPVPTGHTLGVKAPAGPAN